MVVFIPTASTRSTRPLGANDSGTYLPVDSWFMNVIILADGWLKRVWTVPSGSLAIAKAGPTDVEAGEVSRVVQALRGPCAEGWREQRESMTDSVGNGPRLRSFKSAKKH